jgi:hypothetical protein
MRKSEKDGFIHPSMRHIEADAPAAAQKIAYTPKPRKPGPPPSSMPADLPTEPAPEAARPVPHFPPPPSGDSATPLRLPSNDFAFPPPAPASDEKPAQRKISLPFKPKTDADAPKPDAEPHSTATTAPFIPKEGAIVPNLKLRKKPTE